MQVRKFTWFIVVVACAVLIAGAALSGGLKLHGQAQTPNAGLRERAFQLADEKMQVSKLDWILLTARVRALEQVTAHESARHTSMVGMRYDRESKSVIASAFVDPEWLAGAKMDAVKNTLLNQGTSYCVDGLALAESEAGDVLAAVNAGKDCSVHFFTWALGQSDKITTKDVATEEGGRLILK